MVDSIRNVFRGTLCIHKFILNPTEVTESLKQWWRTELLRMVAIKLISSVLLISFIWNASGLLFPGPCPVLEPSHKQLKDQKYWKLTAVVQFTNAFSFFFKETDPVGDMKCYMVETKSAGQIKIEYSTTPQSMVRHGFQSIEGNIVDNGDTLLLESALYDSPRNISKCHSNLTEEIRMWTENGVIILWSCREAENKESHDEAVVVFSLHDGTRILAGLSYDDDLKNAQELTAKYLSLPLVNAIQWPLKTPSSLYFPKNRFLCKGETAEIYLPPKEVNISRTYGFLG